MIEVELPDKDIVVEFPDGMPEWKMRNLIMAEFYGASRFVQAPLEPQATGFLGRMIQGIREREEQLTPEQKAQAVVNLQGGPMPTRLDRLEQFGNSMISGALGTAEGLLGGIEWITGSETARELANLTKAWQQDLAPEDPTFLDEVAMGIGSMATFFIPGLGVASGTAKAAILAPRLASWAGIGTASALEAMTEAGTSFRETLQDTKDQGKAEDAASKTFWMNMVLLPITNRLGVFGIKGKAVRKAIMSSLMEGSQEGAQEIIQAVARNKDIDPEQVQRAAIIGAMVGGGTSIVSHRALPREEIPVVSREEGRQGIETPEMPIEEEVKETETIPPKEEEIPPTIPPKPPTGMPGQEGAPTTVEGKTPLWETGQPRPFSFDPNSTKNEGRFRLAPPRSVDPNYFDKDAYTIKGKKTDFIRRNKFNSVEFPEGIQAVVGKVNGKEQIQAIRFNKNIISEDQASKWFVENAQQLGASNYLEYQRERIVEELPPRRDLEESKTKAIPRKEELAPGDTIDAQGNIRLSEEKRKALIEQSLEGKQSAEYKSLILTGGPPGAGKSSDIKALNLDESQYVPSNADLVKEQTEYEQYADAIHEESSEIAKEIAERAMENRQPLLYDSLLTNFKLANDLIQDVVKDDGYVYIAFTNIDYETSIARSRVRYEKGETKRLVPEGVSLKSYNRSLPTFIELFKRYKDNPRFRFVLYDNNVDFRDSILVFRHENGKTTRYNKELFDKLMKTDYHSIERGDKYERTKTATEKDLRGKETAIHLRVGRLLRGSHAEHKPTLPAAARSAEDGKSQEPPETQGSKEVRSPPSPQSKEAPSKTEDYLKQESVERHKTEAISSPSFRPIRETARRSKIIKDIEKAFDIPIRMRKFRQRALGIYKIKERIIRLKKPNDVEVACHEIGHHIERLMGLPIKMPVEVQQMAYPGAESKSREGFAEFLRYYVTDEAKAKKEAPGFYMDFEQRLKDHPDIQDTLVKARLAWNEYVAAPSTAKVASFIVASEGKRSRPTLNDLYAKLIDELRPIQVLKEKIERQGKKLHPREDPFLLAWLTRGWARKAEQYLKWGTFQLKDDGVKFTGPSLRDILAPIEKKGERELLDTYLVAKRAMNDPRILKGFEGILKPDDFKQTVKELEPRFKETAEKLYLYSDNLIEYLVDAGRISSELADTIRKRNLFYTPLYRVMDADVSVRGLSRKKYGNLFSPVKRLKGSSRDIHSPTESLMRNTYTMINVAERNRIGEALIKIAEMEGMGSMIEKIPVPLKPQTVTKEELIRMVHKYGKISETIEHATTVREIGDTIRNLGKEKEPSEKMEAVALEVLTSRGWTENEAKQIIGRIKSAENQEAKQEIIEKILEKTTIITIIKELGLDEIPDNVLSGFRPNYRTGPNEVIFYNRGKPQMYEMDPELYQAVLSLDADSLNLLVKIAAYPAKWLRAGATLSPEFIARNPARDQLTAFVYSKYGYKPGYDLIRGVFHILGKTELYQKYNASGAAHAALVSLDRDYLDKDLRRLIRKRRIQNYISNPLRLAQVISELTEEATRVGEFVRAIKKEGEDLNALLKAGHAARDITLDFSRIGSKTRAVNAITAFWNAQVQGVDKMIRAFKERPSRTFAYAFLANTLPSILLWLAQHDDKYFQEIPVWRRILFWNIVTHKDDGTLNHIWSIPKSFELGILFGSVPEMALEWAYENDPDAFKDTLRALGEGLAPGFVPTGLLPIFEWWANKSWFLDRPIVPRDKEDLEPLLQYGRYTSETAKIIAKGLSQIPGLDKVASPAKIDNLIRDFTGGLGRLGTDTVDKLLKTFKAVDIPPEPSMTLSDMPGIRGFMQRFPSAHSRSIERFYRRYHRMKTGWESTKERTGIRGTGAEIDRPEELKRFEEIAKGLSIFRKVASITYDRRDLDREEKQKALDSIYLVMIYMARVAIGKEEIKKDELKVAVP